MEQFITSEMCRTGSPSQ